MTRNYPLRVTVLAHIFTLLVLLVLLPLLATLPVANSFSLISPQLVCDPLAKDIAKEENLTVIAYTDSLLIVTSEFSALTTLVGASIYGITCSGNYVIFVGSYFNHPSIGVIELPQNLSEVSTGKLNASLTILENLEGTLYGITRASTEDNSLVVAGYVKVNTSYAGIFAPIRIRGGTAVISNATLILCDKACYIRRIIRISEGTYVMIGGYASGLRYAPLVITHSTLVTEHKLRASAYGVSKGSVGLIPYFGVVSDAGLINEYLVVLVRSSRGVSLHFIEVPIGSDVAYFVGLGSVKDVSYLSLITHKGSVWASLIVSLADGSKYLLVINSYGKALRTEADGSVALIWRNPYSLMTYTLKGTTQITYLGVMTREQTDKYVLSASQVNIEERSVAIKAKHIVKKCLVTILSKHLRTAASVSITAPNKSRTSHPSYVPIGTPTSSPSWRPTPFTRVKSPRPNVLILVLGITLVLTYLLLKRRVVSRH